MTVQFFYINGKKTFVEMHNTLHISKHWKNVKFCNAAVFCSNELFVDRATLAKIIVTRAT